MSFTAAYENDSAARIGVLAGEQARRDALVADDREAFTRLMADDIVHVHTTGIVHDKAALIRHGFEFLRFYNVERGELQVRLFAPDIALMTGKMRNTVGKRGTDERVEVGAFVTQVWCYRDGRWQCVSFHAVRQDA